jgi:hypothetical protein
MPTLSRSIPALIPNGRQTSVMVVCAHESMTLMAVGFKDGTVVTVKGNLTRDRLSTMKVVHSESTPGVYVTGLGFRQVKNRTILLISTSDAVYAVDLTLKTETKLDSIGCELGCSTMTDHTQDYKFVIARSEAVYFYTPEGRAQAFAFEGYFNPFASTAINSFLTVGLECRREGIAAVVPWLPDISGVRSTRQLRTSSCKVWCQRRDDCLSI